MDDFPTISVLIIIVLVFLLVVIFGRKRKPKTRAYPYHTQGVILAAPVYSRPEEAYAPSRATFIPVPRMHLLSQPKPNVLGKLLHMTTELDSDVFTLRQALAVVAPMITDWPDADGLVQIEELCGRSFRGAEVYSAAELNTAASKLELKLASCQVLCALIDIGPLEEGDRSKPNYGHLSLLAQAENEISSFGGRTQEKRQIVEAAKNDLAAARKWMEAASLVLRAVPPSARFADMRVAR